MSEIATPTALITGGTSGIGLATAQLLHGRGFRVMVTGRDPGTLAAAREQLPVDVSVVRADATSMSDIDAIVDEVRDRFGELTAVFLNAGVTAWTPVETATEDVYDNLFATNTKGAFFTLQRVLPLLVDGGSVVFTVGVTVTRGQPGFSLTSASRGALLAMVPTLAAELAPRRIRVNAVSPGAIDTPIWNKSDASSDEVVAMKAAMAQGIPLGRFGTAREVAEAVGYLVSEGAAYVTGQNLVVGGGIDV